MVEWAPVFIVARKELRDRLRSRWVVAVAAIFTVFALVIAYFGAAQGGAVGFQRMDVTITSLVSLVVYLVPLIALILGYDAVVAERERGSLDLLLSQPLTRLELLLGKYLGLAAALALSTIAGFGLVGVLMSYGIGLPALGRYAIFVGSTLMMGLAFLSLAVLVSVTAASRVSASGMAIALWFFFVLIFDLIVLGLLVATATHPMASVMPALLLFNPADVFRILNIHAMEEVRALYGLATVMPTQIANLWTLSLVMTAWVIGPLVLAYRRFRKL
jgi:Cu-processing system permease protein